MLFGLVEGVCYFAAGALALVAYLLVVAVRRRYFSSISDIPGPLFASFSVLWEVWSILGGHIEFKSIALHEKFGASKARDSCYKHEY
jgi:hypothetical protein